MTRPEGGTRERKKRATRAQLEEAAFSLFSRQGYDATTVDEISEAAQVSPRTFFRYFPTKEDVVFGDEEQTLEQLRSVIERGPSDDRAALTAAVRAFSDVLEANREGVLGTQRLVSENPSLRSRALQQEHAWGRAVAGLLAERAGTESPTFEQRVLASCAISVLAASMGEWLRTGATAPLSTFTEQALAAAGTLFG